MPKKYLTTDPRTRPVKSRSQRPLSDREHAAGIDRAESARPPDPHAWGWRGSSDSHAWGLRGSPAPRKREPR